MMPFLRMDFELVRLCGGFYGQGDFRRKKKVMVGRVLMMEF